MWFPQWFYDLVHSAQKNANRLVGWRFLLLIALTAR
jgi:hypothetical protein